MNLIANRPGQTLRQLAESTGQRKDYVQLLIRRSSGQLTSAGATKATRYSINVPSQALAVQKSVNGRRGVGGRSGTKSAPKQRVASTSEIRTWARVRGYAVGDRGRLRSEIQKAWLDAHHQ
jgi:hypothetical protein